MNKTESFAITLLLVVVLFIYSFANTTQSQKLILYFFGSPTCGECLEIKEKILFPAQKKHPDKIELRIYDVDSDSGFQLMLKMEEIYGVKTTASIELFFPDTFLTGGSDIEAYAAKLIEYYLANPQKWKTHEFIDSEEKSFTDNLKDKFQSFSIFSIIAAGLVDGINPCAIATMIFLISFLATQKRTRPEILAIGLAFTFAVFLTYLLLGIGAFKALWFLKKYRWISAAIRWSAVALATGVGLYSFRDAFMYRRTGKTQDIKLQLPKAVKLRIHKVISGQLATKSLVWGALITGFLVTLLEAVCTGQVYLPTIILMTRQQGLKVIGWIYLLLYNFLFVTPLLTIMILAYFGLRWDRLAKTTQKNLVAIKIVFGVVLIALATFLAIAG